MPSSDGPPQLRIPVSIFRRCHAACIASVAACSLASVPRVSTPTLPWSPSLGWNHQFSGPYDGCGECGFHVVHTAVSRRVCPEVPSNRCGHLPSKLGVSHQAPTVHWWFSWGPQPAVSIKMAEELGGCDHNAVVRNGKEGGLRLHRNVLYEFVITMPR